MKTDESYTFISICPTTKLSLSKGDVSHSNGVCPRCGNNRNGTFSHSVKIIGRWKRPNIVEWLSGKRRRFFHKSDEDAVMDALRRDI